ncbi:hypothetical protein OUZ56_002467 [Daphnia magna]|uniref:Uncharacterized protein n=1 Tax=Daphnia magna TaxID=35525 RepID=A0ABR0A682_9CRUS|nr:hypothetical protein OUZ56_002467 [Daphnia magna]
MSWLKLVRTISIASQQSMVTLIESRYEEHFTMLTSYLWVKTLSTEFKFNNYIETEKTHEKTMGQTMECLPLPASCGCKSTSQSLNLPMCDKW